MAIDWKRTDVTHVLTAQMVSQTNLGATVGTLEGVDWASSNIEAAYYTDLRTSGKLVVIGDGWVRGSFIRIIHSIPEFGFKETLGTYVVTDDDAELENGVWRYELELQSTLVMLKDDLLKDPWPIKKGSKALKAMKDVLGSSGAHSMRSALADFGGAEGSSAVTIDDSLADDVPASTALIMESGKSRLECFFALCSMSQNRIDVKPDGYIAVRRRVRHSSKAPKFRFDLEDPRGTVVDGSVSRSTDWLSVPDTIIVEHSFDVEVEDGTYDRKTTDKDGTVHPKGSKKYKTEQRTIRAVAKTPTGPHSVKKRGYSIAEVQQVENVVPHTLARASQVAAELVKNASQHTTWEIDTTYVPLWEGDVVELVVHDGVKEYRGVRKCLVQNVDIDLGSMLMSLTLKELDGTEDD